jgi:hypothetical protein
MPPEGLLGRMSTGTRDTGRGCHLEDNGAISPAPLINIQHVGKEGNDSLNAEDRRQTMSFDH